MRASELGLNEKEVVDNVITALTSDGMIAPSYWVDPKTGNDYLLTVQYPENIVKNLADLGSMPLARRPASRSRPGWTPSAASPTSIARPRWTTTNSAASMDVYVAPSGEDLSRVYAGVQKIIHDTKLPENVRVDVRGSVAGHARPRSRSFGLGLILSTLLVYLILVAQFQSFLDPLLILLAVPTGLDRRAAHPLC